MNGICLDTGVITLLTKIDPSKEILELKKKNHTGSMMIYVLKGALTEAFFHLCQANGKEIATNQIYSLIKNLHFNLVETDEADIILAGTLKCQHHKILSYIDCMEIAYCLNKKMDFHTTEKLISKIPSSILQKLVVVKYQF
jgi:hypothetical protein